MLSKTCWGEAGISTLSLAVNLEPSPAVESTGSSPTPSGRAGSLMPSSVRTFEGVNGNSIALGSTRSPSASATALAMHTGVLMLLPSPTPLAPSGVNGDGVSMCRITGSGTSILVGIR